MFQNERDRKKIAIEIQETTDVCWATEDREHVIMKEIVGGVLQRAHELHVKTGIRLSRTESVKNIGNNN